MIIPLPVVGIAIAGKLLLPKQGRQPGIMRKNPFSRTDLQRRRPVVHTRQNPVIALPGALQNLARGLSSSLSRIIQPKPRENYTDVVQSFLPEDARLVAPQHPVHTGKIQFVDLDGDLEDELVTTYTHSNGTTTLVLKKQNGRWDKVSEIKDPAGRTLNFMSFADITGEGKKQLLLGRKIMDNAGKLYAYSLEEGNTRELFVRDYSRLEIIGDPQSRETPGKAQIAVWDSDTRGTYNTELVHWSGDRLEPVENQAPYYSRRILPYYAQKVKQAPYEPANWYYLADALYKSGMYHDGLTAIEFGMRQNPVSPSKDEFLTLKDRLLAALPH